MYGRVNQSINQSIQEPTDNMTEWQTPDLRRHGSESALDRLKMPKDACCSVM